MHCYLLSVWISLLKDYNFDKMLTPTRLQLTRCNGSKIITFTCVTFIDHKGAVCILYQNNKFFKKLLILSSFTSLYKLLKKIIQQCLFLHLDQIYLFASWLSILMWEPFKYRRPLLVTVKENYHSTHHLQSNFFTIIYFSS